MNRHYLALLLFLGMLIPVAYASGMLGYQLRPGDLLSISVWGEDNLKGEVRVLPDGSISFPLAGQVMAKGKSTSELEGVLKGRLKKYIPEAQVSVTVVSPDGNTVYVLGKVAKPGPVVMSDDSMTVAQALSMAGGLDKFADEDRIKILRTTGEGQIQGYVRYRDIESGKDLTTNYQLMAGDTIVVP